MRGAGHPRWCQPSKASGRRCRWLRVNARCRCGGICAGVEVGGVETSGPVGESAGLGSQLCLPSTAAVVVRAVAIASAPMPDRGRRFDPVLAVGLAIGLALGVLLMHGLDARAVADGHGLTTSPSAIVGASHEPRDTVEAMGDQVASGAGAASASMLGRCIAVLAAGGLLLVLPLAHPATVGRSRKTRCRGSDETWMHLAPKGRVGRPPPLPRVALCVSLC